MVLRKQEAKKVEAKVKSSRAVAYADNGKVAKGALRKLEATLLSSVGKSAGGSAAPATNGGANGTPSSEEGIAKGRPGRKPKQSAEQLLNAGADAVPEAVDTGDDPSVQIVEKMSATKLRAKDRRAKEKALKEALERSYHGTEEDLETRRNKLKALIKLGKERGFLTYAEINDHLPDALVDAEAIDAIISTFSESEY